MRRVLQVFAVTLVLAAGTGFAQTALQPAPDVAIAAKASEPAPAIRRTFASWKTACDKTPSNRSLGRRLPPREILPLPQFRELDQVLTAFYQQCKTGAMSRTELWVGKKPGTNDFFKTTSAYFTKSGAASIPFQPFAEKLEVPSDAEVYFHADFHGDVRSLMTDLTWLNEKGYLRDFTVARTNFYMVFLGDYTDRGAYGIEVIYTLLRLKLANPENVHLLRGNHEEVSLQSRYGFLDEGRAKYGPEFDATKILRAYDFLPVVLYLGSGGNFIQCNHGGMEPGFSPGHLLDGSASINFQFIGSLNQHQYFSSHADWFAGSDPGSRDLAARALQDFRPDDPISPSTLGFMWNDFSVLESDRQFDIDPGRAFVYGQRSSQYILRHAGTEAKHIQAVFRGHQQSQMMNPMMSRLIAGHGVFRHWQAADSPALLNASVSEVAKVIDQSDSRPIPEGSVWTFNVSPDSLYGIGCNYNFDAFGILKTPPQFADWRLSVINLTIPQ